MEMSLTPLSDGPVVVSKIGGSMKITIPPAFFVVSGISKMQPLEAEVFFDGVNMVAKIRPVAEPAQP